MDVWNSKNNFCVVLLVYLGINRAVILHADLRSIGQLTAQVSLRRTWKPDDAMTLHQGID